MDWADVPQYTTLDEYFRDHPEEEEGFINDMCEEWERQQALNNDFFVEYPEDYVLEAVNHEAY